MNAKLTIPPELVPLLRDGLFFDLHDQLREAGALVEPGDRQDIRAGVDGRLARAQATRRLLDAVGWYEPEEGPPTVVVDVWEHREALLRALQTRVESENGVAADTAASDAEKTVAQARAEQLADLIRRVEEVEVGPAEREPRDPGTERLLVQHLVFVDRPEGRTRRELETCLRDVDREVVGDALRDLEAAGVVILEGKRVRPSRCALRLDALGVICL